MDKMALGVEYPSKINFSFLLAYLPRPIFYNGIFVCRAKVMNGIDRSVYFVAYGFFMVRFSIFIALFNSEVLQKPLLHIVMQYQMLSSFSMLRCLIEFLHTRLSSFVGGGRVDDVAEYCIPLSAILLIFVIVSKIATEGIYFNKLKLLLNFSTHSSTYFDPYFCSFNM